MGWTHIPEYHIQCVRYVSIIYSVGPHEKNTTGKELTPCISDLWLCLQEWKRK